MMTVMRDGSPLRHSTRPIRRTQATPEAAAPRPTAQATRRTAAARTTAEPAAARLPVMPPRPSP
jgi:hypothetical protein